MKKILVNSYTVGGCGKFRVNDPHQMLQEIFKDEDEVDKMLEELFEDEVIDEVEVTFNNNINYKDELYLKQFDLILFHNLPYFAYSSQEEFYRKMLKDIKRLFKTTKRLNIKVVVDIDDYWRKSINNQIIIECVSECLLNADWIILHC